MSKMLADESCRSFAELLSSSAPVPGGGGAAALMGALSVSLCSMSASLSKGKKKYAQYEELIENSILKAARLRERFLQLIDEDAEAFLPLSKAYSIDKNDPEREAVIERESLNACAAAMEMLRLCGKATELLEDIYSVGNQLLLSDVGCGAAACEGAIKSAAMNVLVNTGNLKENETAKQYNAEISDTLGEYLPRLKVLCDNVMERLRR